jgi:hypothetical protein
MAFVQTLLESVFLGTNMLITKAKGGAEHILIRRINRAANSQARKYNVRVGIRLFLIRT